MQNNNIHHGKTYLPAQWGGSQDQLPLDRHCALEHPVRLKPESQLNLALLLKIVPRDVTTFPFLGASILPQSKAVYEK